MAAGIGRVGVARQALNGRPSAGISPSRRKRRSPSRRFRRGRHRLSAALAVLAVIAGSLTIPAGASSAATSAPQSIITDASGPTFNAGAAWLEQTAISQVLADYQLPDSDADQVMTWARAQVRAQEWAELAQIIDMAPTKRSADEQSAYNWFEGKVRDVQVGEAQQAVNEYLKWSGLNESDYTTDQPVNYGPNGTGYCNYHAPGPFDSGTKPTYDGRSSAFCFPNCTLACFFASPPTPDIDDFVTWGTYDEQAAIVGATAAEQSDATRKAIAVAGGSTALASAGAFAGVLIGNPTKSVTLTGMAARIFASRVARRAIQTAVKTMGRQAIRLMDVSDFYEAGEPIEIVVSDVAPVLTASDVTVVTIVITGLIDMAIETYKVVEANLLPGKLHDALAEAEDTSKPLDLQSMLSSGDGADGLLGVLVANTNAVSTVTATPVEASDADQHFEVTPLDTMKSTVQRTVSLQNSLSPTGLEVRPTTNNWFVTTLFDPATGSPQGSLQALNFPFISWSGLHGVASVHRDADGTNEFHVGLEYGPDGLDDSSGSTDPTSQCSLLTGTTSCATKALQVTLSTGAKATIQLVQTPVTPSVNTISYGPQIATDTVAAGQPISFLATGTDPQGLPLSYTWSFPWQCRPPYPTDPLTEAGLGELCNQETPSVLHGPIAGYVFYQAGTQTVTVTATNTHGESTTRQLAITVLGDTTAPTVTFANTPATPTGAGGWYTSAVHGTVVATDPAAKGQSSSGARRWSCTDQVTGGIFDLTYDGIYQVSCAADDNLGNISAIKTDTVKIDTAPPTAMEIVGEGSDAAPGDNGWYRKGPVIEKISMQDAACPLVIDASGDGAGDSTTGLRTPPTPYTCQPSGLATTSCPGMTGGNGQYSVTLVADGSTAPVCTATDNAGNTATFTLPFRGIDSTPPDLTVDVQPKAVLVGANPPAVVPDADDTGSGLASVSCDPAGTDAVGTVTVSCRAVDKAGNATSRSATYTVGYAVSAALDPAGADPSELPVTVTASGAHGQLDDNTAAALAADCQVTVGLDGAAAPGTGCASYDTTRHAFTETVAIPGGTTGSHQLVIDIRSGGNVVGTGTIPLQLDSDGTPQMPAPVILTSPPRDQTAAAGSAAAFAATALGRPMPTEQWQVSADGGASWSDIDGATGTVLSLPAVTTSMDGHQYRAVFANELSTVISPAARLTVGGAPPALVITASPTDQVATPGGSATFTVAAVPTPSRVQWQQSTDGGAVWADVASSPQISPSPTGDSITISGITTGSDGTRYRAELFSPSVPGDLAAISIGATLHVASAPVVTAQPADETVGVGATASFSAAASGEPAPHGGWQVSTDDGAHWKPVSGSPDNPSVLQVSSVTLDMSGNEYEAVFGNESDVAASSPARLTVVQGTTSDPSFGVRASPRDQIVPVGRSATFTAAAAGDPTPTVQWQFQSAGTSTWTPIDGAVSTALTVPEVGTADRELTGDWNADRTRYRAVFTAQDGSRRTATTDAATLTVGTPPQVVLNPVDVSASGRAPGAFTASATGTPTPTVQWQHRIDGAWITITGATATSLAPRGASGTAYRAVFSNVAGTAVTTPATYTTAAVDSDVPPLVVLSPKDQTVAAGTAATFTGLAFGSPAPAVRWQRSTDGITWTDVPGATSSTLVTGTLRTADTGTRYRAVFTGDGVTAIGLPATVTVTGPDPAAPTVTAQPQYQQAQVGSDATFIAAATGVPAPTVQWQIEADGVWHDIPGATAASLVVGPVTEHMQHSFYRAVFTNGSGSVSTDPAGLAVYQRLAVTTTSLPAATAGSPFSVQLDSSGGSDDPQSWYLPAGSTLPPGLTLAPSGLLSGTPTAAGHYTFAVDIGDPAQATLTLDVAAAPPPTTGGAPSGTAAPPTSSISGSPTAAGSTTPSAGGTGRPTGSVSSGARAGTGGATAGATDRASGSGTVPSTTVLSSSTGNRSELSYTGVPAVSELMGGIGLLTLGGLLLLAGGRRRRRSRHA